jgi:hypothetical protein
MPRVQPVLRLPAGASTSTSAPKLIHTGRRDVAKCPEGAVTMTKLTFTIIHPRRIISKPK